MAKLGQASPGSRIVSWVTGFTEETEAEQTWTTCFQARPPGGRGGPLHACDHVLLRNILTRPCLPFYFHEGARKLRDADDPANSRMPPGAGLNETVEDGHLPGPALSSRPLLTEPKRVSPSSVGPAPLTGSSSWAPHLRLPRHPSSCIPVVLPAPGTPHRMAWPDHVP